MKDNAILAQQQQQEEEEEDYGLDISAETNLDTQATIGSHITVRPRSPSLSQVFDLTSSSSSASLSDDELPDIPYYVPPTSIAPPAL